HWLASASGRLERNGQVGVRPNAIPPSTQSHRVLAVPPQSRLGALNGDGSPRATCDIQHGREARTSRLISSASSFAPAASPSGRREGCTTRRNGAGRGGTTGNAPCREN